jgi:hypothetical protein
MIKRKAILLKYSENDLVDYKNGLDIGLVKSFLKSSPGGSFEYNEIIELNTYEIKEIDLLREIDQVDYSFVYFTGHAHFIDRSTWIPSKNDGLIRVTDLQRRNKKQWFFIDCCRTNSERIQSPEFSFERNSIHFSEGNEKARKAWMQDIVRISKDICTTYYTTEMGKHSFVNEDGGYVTQLFFTNLSKLLEDRREINLNKLVSIINEKEDTLQKGALWSDNAEKIIFRN